VQEEATKLSKRAKRRAAGEEGVDEALEGAAADEASADDEGQESVPPEEGAEPAPNRQARRTAAAKARTRRKREREAATAMGLDAGEMVDDALVRFTAKVRRVLRQNANALQWAVGLGVLGWLGWQVYGWRRATVNAEASDALYEAVTLEHGRTGDPSEQGKANANGVVDPTPIFENDAARLQAAAQRYEAVASDKANVAAGAFARIGQAGVLLEQAKPEDARAAFEQAASMKGAELSPEVRGGAIEGRALSLEAKGDLPGALAAFEELAKIESFETRGLYQQARIKQLQGDSAAAKQLLNSLFKSIGAPKAASIGGLPERPDFLRQRATRLAALVDPLEKDVKIPKPPMGADAVQQMLDQLKESGALTSPPANP
jgi:predicted negative regulator of RcsB-dependent stress response